MQIRVRLTIQFICITASILLAAFVFIHFQFKINLQDEYYDSLKSKAHIIADMVTGKTSLGHEFEIEEISALKNPADPTHAGEIAVYNLDGRRLYIGANDPENISIYSMDGRRLYHFNPVPDDIDPATLEEIRENGHCRFTHGQASALGVTYESKAGGKYIVIAESVFDPVHIHNLSRILIIVFLLSISLIAVGGWFFARQALAPVSRIMNQVDTLLPTDMSHRLETTNQHDELSRLVITFNKLLDRIQRVFTTQKMFLSNISHELKNPLNVIISQVEVTLDKDRTPEEYRQTLASVLSDTQELNQVADHLMLLARIKADDASIPFLPLRIDELIWQSKDLVLKNHPEYTIHFEVVNLPELETQLQVQGNEQLLKTAITNLMDNGCKFSPDKSVRVRLSFHPSGQPCVEISDTGPGIPEEEISMIFNAFYRSARTRAVKGSGIGLSLVDSILRLHHIDLQLRSKAGEGTTFALQFPLEKLNRMPV